MGRPKNGSQVNGANLNSLVTSVHLLHRADGTYTRCALVITNTKPSARLIRGIDHSIRFQSKIVSFRAKRLPGWSAMCKNGNGHRLKRKSVAFRKCNFGPDPTQLRRLLKTANSLTWHVGEETVCGVMYDT
ncbi:hypothetical protein Tco_0521898, partial [Tanacetum coccineum]